MKKTRMFLAIVIGADCSKHKPDSGNCKECNAYYQNGSTKSQRVCSDEEETAFRNNNRYGEVTCY